MLTNFCHDWRSRSASLSDVDAIAIPSPAGWREGQRFGQRSP
jgi:hypothetical protein